VIYNENLFAEDVFEVPLISGTALYTVTFYYYTGMAVILTASCVCTTPDNTNKRMEASFDNGLTWTEFDFVTGVCLGAFDVDVSGNQDLLLKLTLETTDTNFTPIIDSLNLTIRQRVSLYTLAVRVLKNAGLTPNQYWIDPELLEYQIPYAWIDKKTHRECLRLIAEACAGQVYMDPNDILRIEGPSYLENVKTISVTELNADNYFGKSNPAVYASIANYIEIMTQPLVPATIAEEVYKSGDSESIAIGQVKTLTVFYTKKPVIEASASLSSQPAGTTITSATYYAWGAVVEVTGGGTAGTFTLTITGKPLEVKGGKLVVAKDDQSILENGKLFYELPDNPFIQSEEFAQKLADKILALSKDPRRDFAADWRGNPALELGDMFTAPDSKTTVDNYWITSQEFTWDGTLSAKIKGKKVL
jgi:hypothetical protein